jgi:hypothetical protein
MVRADRRLGDGEMVAVAGEIDPTVAGRRRAAVNEYTFSPARTIPCDVS